MAERGSYAYTDDKGNPKVEVYVYARVASPKAKKWPGDRCPVNASPAPTTYWRRLKLLIEQNRGRNSLFDQMDRIYDQERTESAPESDDSVVLVRMPHGTNAVDLITDLLAQSEMVITVPAASEAAPAKREADLEEKWLRAWLQKNERIQDRTSCGRSLVCGNALGGLPQDGLLEGAYRGPQDRLRACRAAIARSTSYLLALRRGGPGVRGRVP